MKEKILAACSGNAYRNVHYVGADDTDRFS